MFYRPNTCWISSMTYSIRYGNFWSFLVVYWFPFPSTLYLTPNITCRSTCWLQLISPWKKGYVTFPFWWKQVSSETRTPKINSSQKFLLSRNRNHCLALSSFPHTEGWWERPLVKHLSGETFKGKINNLFYFINNKLT